MQVSRATEWCHDLASHDAKAGYDAGVAAMRNILKVDIDRIAEVGSDIYSSTDMSTGIDTVGLGNWRTLLDRFWALDPRGGYINQDMLADALHDELSVSPALEQAMAAIALRVGQSYSQHVSTTAYKIRVMLAHRRIKFDCTARQHGDSGGDGSRRKDKRSHVRRDRTKIPKINPFIYFRDASPPPASAGTATSCAETEVDSEDGSQEKG